MHAGEIIHNFRIEKKMTLLELSRKSGVALATLSRIENGRMTGTLRSHMSICKALEIPLVKLYKNLAKLTIEHHRAGADVSFSNKSVSLEKLVTNVTDKKMMPLSISMHKGGETQKETSSPGTEKFIYITHGKVEVVIGEKTHILKKGDAIYLETTSPYYFKNIGKGEARLIYVVCPPLI